MTKTMIRTPPKPSAKRPHQRTKCQPTVPLCLSPHLISRQLLDDCPPFPGLQGKESMTAAPSSIMPEPTQGSNTRRGLTRDVISGQTRCSKKGKLAPSV